MQGPSMTREDTVGSTAVQSIPPGAVSRFRPSAWRAAACVLALAFALLLGADAAEAQTSVTLVSNTGQSTDSTTVITLGRAQAFTTGGNAAGYKLTSVTFPVTGTLTSSDISTLEMRIESSGSNNKPGGSLGALTITQSGTTVTGTTTGIDLAANTTYFVVWVGAMAGTITGITYHRTNSDSEDAGAAAGWSIGDGSLWGGSWSSSSNVSWKIAIHGYAKSTGTTATPRSPASEEQQRVVKRTLAAVASRSVAGALDHIGTRLGDAVPAAGLSLAGETVRFGGTGAAGPDGVWPPGGGESRGMEAGDLLGSSAFSLALGAAPGNKEGDERLDSLAPRWAVWGRGDFGSFSGRPDAVSSYRGETRTGWLGVDAREAPRGSDRPGRWVAGLAVSRGMSETDYTLDDEKGRIETDLTALWPYGRWTFGNGLELGGMLGAGRGEARHMPGDGEPAEKSNLTMRAGSVGLKRKLPPLGGIALAAQGDGSLARMRTAKGGGEEGEEQAVDGIRADVWRARAGIEASRRIGFDDGSTLTPFVETAGRRDGGDGLTGTGLELAGGVRVAAPGLAVEARGRWLAAHSEKGADERGASLTVRMQPEPDGRGLSLSLSPRWGAPSGGAGALWREELPRGAASGATNAREAGALEGELGYGFGLLGGRLTGTPNAGFGASDGGGRDYRVGWRLTPAVPGYAGFRVDLDATRRESANGNEPPAHGAILTGAIRW